ncbi:hypothetical protein Golob_021033 [Gossypium lobatum]|uniref:Choline transporter-like protein n=1 Tax=Gossypium lobatum TaxID=34289 RepID=A0A7J8LCB5_9ROSI|nr:hypothetical protein [Gossypium lobatum]
MRGPLGAVQERYPLSDGTTEDGGIIRHNRKCRDVAFLVIFIAFWVAMIVNSSFGFNQGNPLRSLLPVTDSSCMFIAFVWSDDNCGSVIEGDIHLSMDDWIDRNYDYYEILTPEMKNASLQLQGPCYPVIFPSVNVYWSCQYIARASNASLRHWKQMGGVDIKEDIVVDKSIHSFINSRSSVLKRYMADIGKAWPVLIVCGGLLPLFLSVVWLLMIRYFVAAMPWITVAFFNILIITVTVFYYLKAGWIGNDAISPIIGDHDPYIHVFGRELNHLRAAAILMTFVMVLSILTSIAIVRRILMGTSVLKARAKKWYYISNCTQVAAKVIGEVQALIIFPVIPYSILAIFYMVWISAALHLFSSGQVVQNNCNTNCCAYDLLSEKVNCDHCCGYSIRYTPHIAVAIFFHLFGCYWATKFFIACSSTVIAGSVASYYWTRGETSSEVPVLPVFDSMKRLIRYSLGSVALGSLIVSFVESIRFILESFHRKLKVTETTPDSWFGKMVYHTSQGCLRCVEWTIKSVNRNAYIMIAITGKSFCRSSALATELIMNNILRLVRVNVIGDVILFLGKLFVSLSSAVFGFLVLDTHKYSSGHNKLSSPLLPVLVCWTLGYVVAALFFAVVEMSIDTLILSFCQDSEEHEGTAQFAPLLLMETLNEQNDMERLTRSYGL